MTGNATEEWLLTRLDYPGHLDAGRMAGLGASAAGIASGLAAHMALPAWGAVMVGLMAAALVGGAIWRRWTRREIEERAAALAAARARAEAETRARIEQMRRREMEQGPREAAERGLETR